MRARAAIDESALAHNLSVVRKRAPGCRVFSVVKANAYGHGLERVARSLSATDGYAVARLEEAIRLRDAGLAHPILLLEGVFTDSELRLVARHHLDTVVHTEDQLRLIEGYQGPGRLKVWLKIDTGMGRLGIPVEKSNACQTRLERLPWVHQGLRLMSHFACADDPENAATSNQIDAFESCSEGAHVSLANSAGILAWPGSLRDPPDRQNWVRAGLMLYGVSPVMNTTAADFDLRPVMTLSSQVIAVRDLPVGAKVGYGGTWTAQRNSRVAVAAAGYGDGVPWHGHNVPVLVNGKRAELVGRVSMDMVSIDVTDLATVKAGDLVQFWGEGLPIEEVAAQVGTIPYTLLCGVTERARHPG